MDSTVSYKIHNIVAFNNTACNNLRIHIQINYADHRILKVKIMQIKTYMYKMEFFSSFSIMFLSTKIPVFQWWFSLYINIIVLVEINWKAGDRKKQMLLQQNNASSTWMSRDPSMYDPVPGSFLNVLSCAWFILKCIILFLVQS